MGIFDRFPYSSTHEMNLDYMLGKATEIAEDMQTVTAGMAQVQAGLTAISEKTEQATQAAAQAAASASSIEGSVTAAEEAAEEAQMHNESAQTWANNAMTYKADCQRSATEAAASSSSAAQAATAAAASEDTVATYAQAANASAQSAANNNDSAHQYANQASASASNATFHSSNAQTAATNAQTAATNAQTAATRTAALKDDCETLHRMCTAAVDQAATEAVNAANSAAQAAAAKTDVENLVESLPEDFTDLNNTVNQLSDEIAETNVAISLNDWIPIATQNSGTGYINANDGTVASGTVVYCTNFVNVASYEKIKYKMILTPLNVYTYTMGIAFYDDTETYIEGYGCRGGQVAYGYQDDIVNVPNNSKYARFSCLIDTDTYGEFELYGTPKLYDIASDVDHFIIDKNLFDKSAITSGKYVHSNNGSLVDYAGTFVSDYIPVRRGNTYSFRVAASLYGPTSAPRLCLYDESKTYIGYSTGTIVDDIVTVKVQNTKDTYSTVGVPAYARFTDYLNRIDSSMFVDGTYPTTYYAYGKNILDESFGLNNRQIAEVAGITGSGFLSGKKIAYNGDSIAESRLQTTNANNGGAYAKIIADLTGGTYQNNAVSGGILASAVPEGTMPHSVVNTVANMPDDADLICFEGGINDYWRDVPLGDYSESDYSGTLDTTTVCGALESIFRQAITKWVGKPICFVIVHKIKSTVYVANSAGYTFAQAREKMLGICHKYAIPVYDAFSESGLNAYNDIQNTTFLTSNSSGTPDGCHPNENGYKKYYVPQLIALFESIIPRS